ncbi:3-deoxy-manno-octulosonate cytidylyltransferase [Mesorhizobium sp. M0114]|uniref:3-deoxy-manno-octulosonate cytidylyltransferase n=1 Tax=unclassified Mesorhizobium TaxID=325217 RepID=UPI00333DAA18
MDCVIMIPARLASTRLPGKPLLDINGVPMIGAVLQRAREANLGPVWVATDSPEVASVVRVAGGNAVLTDPNHQSGSDRIYEALSEIDPERRFDVVVNLQGDLPTVSAATIHATLDLLGGASVDVSTPIALIEDELERNSPDVVKMVGVPLGEGRHRALYFTRCPAPWGDGPCFHHIGLYAWRRSALEKFVELPKSYLEQREKLEQLRALEAGIRIDAIEVAEVPVGVDTAADLEKARSVLRQRS